MRRASAAVAVGGCATAYRALMSETSQLLGPFPYRAEAAERLAAITFDDGPNEPHTTRLAGILRARDVRATFFQVGANVARQPDVARTLLADGHVIGNHSYSHAFGQGLGARTVEDELDRATDVFGAELGVSPRLYRPPWLLRTPALFRALRQRDMTAVSGRFCHPFEVARIAPARIAAKAVARARPGVILIFHDGYNATGGDRAGSVAAAEATLDALLERGYAFTTVDRLLGVAAYA